MKSQNQSFWYNFILLIFKPRRVLETIHTLNMLNMTCAYKTLMNQFVLIWFTLDGCKI